MVIISDKISPILTKQHIIDSLNRTNSYCLQGIVSSKQGFLKRSEEMEFVTTKQIPGLSAVVSVMEEILKWPSSVGILWSSLAHVLEILSEEILYILCSIHLYSMHHHCGSKLVSFFTVLLVLARHSWCLELHICGIYAC